MKATITCFGDTVTTHPFDPKNGQHFGHCKMAMNLKDLDNLVSRLLINGGDNVPTEEEPNLAGLPFTELFANFVSSEANGESSEASYKDGGRFICALTKDQADAELHAIKPALINFIQQTMGPEWTLANGVSFLARSAKSLPQLLHVDMHLKAGLPSDAVVGVLPINGLQYSPVILKGTDTDANWSTGEFNLLSPEPQEVPIRTLNWAQFILGPDPDGKSVWVSLHSATRSIHAGHVLPGQQLYSAMPALRLAMFFICQRDGHLVQPMSTFPYVEKIVQRQGELPFLKHCQRCDGWVVLTENIARGILNGGNTTTLIINALECSLCHMMYCEGCATLNGTCPNGGCDGNMEAMTVNRWVLSVAELQKGLVWWFNMSYHVGSYMEICVAVQKLQDADIMGVASTCERTLYNAGEYFKPALREVPKSKMCRRRMMIISLILRSMNVHGLALVGRRGCHARLSQGIFSTKYPKNREKIQELCKLALGDATALQSMRDNVGGTMVKALLNNIRIQKNNDEEAHFSATGRCTCKMTQFETVNLNTTTARCAWSIPEALIDVLGPCRDACDEGSLSKRCWICHMSS